MMATMYDNDVRYDHINIEVEGAADLKNINATAHTYIRASLCGDLSTLHEQCSVGGFAVPKI